MSEVNSTNELLHILAELDFSVGEGVELCGGDDEFYCELIRELHSDVLVKRNDSLGSGDPQKRREYAHLLKGTLKVLGEKRASQRAREVEQAIRNGEADDELTKGLLADLEQIDLSLGAFFARTTS